MFNNVNLIGYLGRDGESRTTRDNSTFALLSLATKRTWQRPRHRRAPVGNDLASLRGLWPHRGVWSNAD